MPVDFHATDGMMKTIWNSREWVVMKKLMLVLMLLFSAYGQAGELSSSVQQEITHLFSYLANSGCQFNRNGSWYDAKAAMNHINDKYQYLLGKDRISTAEDFIEGAASRSSMSGRAYLVKCGDGPSIESGVWFRVELEKFRKAAHSKQPVAKS